MAPLIQEVIADEEHCGEQITEFDLSQVEETLRKLLLDAAEYIEATPKPPSADGVHLNLPEELASQPLILRFAGGWVRDKLLGVASHDIDVAINKMTGLQFGLRLKEYLELPGVPEKYGLEGVATTDKANAKAGSTDKSKTVGGLHKIEANPEKSKNLETATIRVLGLDVDLVNLRKETYNEDSRNPQMEFGTPREDAMRRDATVNAMFYNITTEELEDFTGRGREDMRLHIIRTPLEPYQTFRDDPLRVLRLIRFASRLGYSIEPSALEAMNDRSIKDALGRKISRERVGVELEKALRGPDPKTALELIFKVGLYETVFSDPSIAGEDHFTPDISNWEALLEGLEDVVNSDTPVRDILIRDDEERYLAWQLSALLPYRDAPSLPPVAPGKKIPPPIPTQVAREGIKATNKLCDVVTAAVSNQPDITGLVDRLDQRIRHPNKTTSGEDASARDVLGMAVRRWGGSWRSQVIWAMMAEVVESPEAFQPVERKYNLFVKTLETLELLNVTTLKPILDGTSLAKALDAKPGPWMKDALDVVIAYQLRHPSTATTENAVHEVRSYRENQGELTLTLVEHFLKLTIRPLFLKAKPAGITNQARKKTQEMLPTKITTESLNDSKTKPWKSEKDAFALDLLKWVILSLDKAQLEQVWPLVVPPVLTLVDDWEVKFKTLGCQMLRHLLEVTPSPLLARTGLGEVFHDALMPCLTYLPTITPERDSIPLLRAAYSALFQLVKVRFPSDFVAAKKGVQVDSSKSRVKVLDCILRQGVVYGCTHCSQYPGILTVQYEQLAVLMHELGIDSVKHLQYTLPLITETLAHPLLGDYRSSTDDEEMADHPTHAIIMQTMLSASKALQAVISNCWPRMVRWRAEVLKGITLCWLKLDNVQSSSEAETEVRESLMVTVAMLRAAVERDCDFASECAQLIDVEPRLSELLKK